MMETHKDTLASRTHAHSASDAHPHPTRRDYGPTLARDASVINLGGAARVGATPGRLWQGDPTKLHSGAAGLNLKLGSLDPSKTTGFDRLQESASS